MEYPKAVIKKEVKEKNIFKVDMSKVCDILPFGSTFNDICSRASLEFTDKGIYLSKNYDWQIVRDSGDDLVLLKLKK